MAGGRGATASAGRERTAARADRLVEAIYDAAVEPAGWTEVMRQLRERFRTRLEALYFLDLEQRALRLVEVAGVEPVYLRSFSDRYFTPDNPCLRSEPLHRPGVVRTDERLARYFRDPAVLRRSQYYNDWMRPQELEHTMGTTLSADGGTVAYVSVLRAGDAGAFRPDEVGGFASLCGHLRRAFRIGRRLDTLTARASAARETLDCLPHAVLLLDLAGRLVHANRAGDALLRRGTGLTLRQGRLGAAAPRDRERLAALVRTAATGAEAAGGPVGHASISRAEPERPLGVSAIRLSAAPRLSGTDGPMVLVLAVDPDTVTPAPADLLRQRYGLTAAEARLALALLHGGGLRRAADAAGMTYETARWYLKILFQKTQTGRQAELVARLLREDVPLAAP
jgi:DNA-binding CsgD family transcriptional regulator/PAS domain-containing protein